MHDQSRKTSRINKKGNSQQRNPTHRNHNLLQEMTVIGAMQNRHIHEKPALFAMQNASGAGRMNIIAINASRASQNPKVQDEVQDEDYINVAFLGEVQSCTNTFWTADLHINKHPTSGVTIISEKTPWLKQFPPQPNTRQFSGARNVDLADHVTGQISNSSLEIAGEAVTKDIFVMRGQNHNLLSKRACQQLKLLKPSEVVYNIVGTQDFRAEFPNLFKGLG